MLSVNRSLTKNKGLPLPIVISFMHFYFSDSLLIASWIIYEEVAVYNDLCIGKCDASCPYIVYRHFTPKTRGLVY